MISFSASPQAVKRIWEPPSPDIKRSGSGERVLVHMLQGAARQQLQPGPQLDELQGKFLSSVHRSMSWEEMSPKVILSSTPEGVRTISLLQWTREVLLEGATTSFFGPALLRVEPALFENFFSFDDKSWKLAYKIPAPWANDMIAAKLTAQNALTRYLDVPKEQRPGACFLVENLEKELRAAGMESSDIAAYLMMYYWVYVSSPRVIIDTHSMALLTQYAPSGSTRMHTRWHSGCSLTSSTIRLFLPASGTRFLH